MTGHRPFSELTKDFSPQRKAEIEALTNQLREEMTLRDSAMHVISASFLLFTFRHHLPSQDLSRSFPPIFYP